MDVINAQSALLSRRRTAILVITPEAVKWKSVGVYGSFECRATACLLSRWVLTCQNLALQDFVHFQFSTHQGQAHHNQWHDEHLPKPRLEVWHVRRRLNKWRTMEIEELGPCVDSQRSG